VKLSLLLVPLAALTLAACGEHHAMSGHSTGAASAPATAGHNAQDVTFAQMNRPKGPLADAKALADSIVTSQSAEIATMRKLLG
jgi:uncharacterized protein (DUF305 family)